MPSRTKDRRSTWSRSGHVLVAVGPGAHRQTTRVVELFGAGNRVRTGDLNLGKVALYQLSYSRTVRRHFARVALRIQVLSDLWCCLTPNKSLNSTDGVGMTGCGRGMASPLRRPDRIGTVGARPCLARIRRRAASPTIPEAMPRPHPETPRVAHRPEAMPRPPSGNRGYPDPVSYVLNSRARLPNLLSHIEFDSLARENLHE